jgi:hypothetical protein
MREACINTSFVRHVYGPFLDKLGATAGSLTCSFLPRTLRNLCGPRLSQAHVPIHWRRNRLPTVN